MESQSPKPTTKIDRFRSWALYTVAGVFFCGLLVAQIHDVLRTKGLTIERIVTSDEGMVISEQSKRAPKFKRIYGKTDYTNLFGRNQVMRRLIEKYSDYMNNVASKINGSLTFHSMLSPTGHVKGQVKINFGIDSLGNITSYETVNFENASPNARIFAERVLVDAAPFEKLSEEMAADEDFKNLTLTINM